MEIVSELLRRNYSFEIRADSSEEESGKGIITGRPIVYESKTNLGWFDEIIEKGALDKADLSDVRFLVNHDTSKIPLARYREGAKGSTMTLEVDDKGMSIRVELDIENNTEAKNLYSAIKRGDITGMSFMFGIDSEEWKDLESEHPTRIIKAISVVVEVSAVTFPAYEETEINARDQGVLENARNAMEAARAKYGDDLELEKLKAKYIYGI